MLKSHHRAVYRLNSLLAQRLQRRPAIFNVAEISDGEYLIRVDIWEGRGISCVLPEKIGALPVMIRYRAENNSVDQYQRPGGQIRRQPIYDYFRVSLRADSMLVSELACADIRYARVAFLQALDVTLNNQPMDLVSETARAFFLKNVGRKRSLQAMDLLERLHQVHRQYYPQLGIMSFNFPAELSELAVA